MIHWSGSRNELRSGKEEANRHKLNTIIYNNLNALYFLRNQEIGACFFHRLFPQTDKAGAVQTRVNAAKSRFIFAPKQ